MKRFYVYILANRSDKTFITGMTSDIKHRLYQHLNIKREAIKLKQTKNDLLYYEIYFDFENAAFREYQLKKSNRQKKLKLIQQRNPDRRNLFNDFNSN